MLRNYLIAAVRILTKEKLYAAINAIGLAVGLAVCFLIYSWVTYEKSYDRHFPDSDRLYRVVTLEREGDEAGIASTYPMVRTRILSQFPEVEVSGRLFNQGLLGSKTRVTWQDKVFINNDLYFGDSTVLSLFHFQLLRGNSRTALHKPNAVVLTQSMAQKVFGAEDPVGKTIVIGQSKEYEVTGVMQDLPPNTHFHFDLLASMQAHPWIKSAEENVWSGVVFHTYVKLKDGSSPRVLETKIRNLLDHFPNDPGQFSSKVNLHLQPLTDIHLKSNLKFELGVNGNILYVRLFTFIALLVLVVAVMNYSNLTTARHTQRFKEVGVRKVMGASRGQLIAQFMIESLVITAVAFLFGVLLVSLSKPVIGSLAGGNDFVNVRPVVWMAAAVFTFVLGLVTGLLPAFTLSSFKPVRLFKPFLSAPGGFNLRKALVVSQFTISMALTICTAITWKQVNFLRGAKLGYDLEHTVVVNIGYPEVRSKYELLKARLAGHSSILGATATSQLPTDVQTGENIDISPSESRGVNCMSVDPDFFRVMNVEVKEGAGLVQGIRPSDSLNYFVLNEEALATIGWREQEAIRKMISIRHGNQKPGPVMGVIGNFHFQSLHHAIGPLVLEFNPDDFQYLLVKLKAGNPEEALRFIASEWKEITPAIPFDYQFLDQQYNNLYKGETQSASLFIFFSIISLFISLLGLFGLSSFSAERRVKEFGIRKILGAAPGNIVALVSKDFLLLVAISFLLAVPVAWYFMTHWLAMFAFRASAGPLLFIAAGMLNLALSLFTILYHSLRAAHTNPAETLKYE